MPHRADRRIEKRMSKTKKIRFFGGARDGTRRSGRWFNGLEIGEKVETVIVGPKLERKRDLSKIECRSRSEFVVYEKHRTAEGWKVEIF